MYNVYMIHVWSLAGGDLSFARIDDMSFKQAKRFYNYHFLVAGKTASVHCFFDDYDIRDSELKKVATSFMKGTYTLHSVDLYSLKESTSQGIDLTNPRY